MKKFLACLKWIVVTLFSFCVACALGFFLVVGAGALPEIQSIWIGTAMTTFHHHYYAEWFVPQSKILEVTSQNEVDDSNVESKTPITTPKPVETVDAEAEEEKKYKEEGYQKLSSGVYLKEITGSTRAGGYMGYLMLCSDPSRVKLVDTDRQFSVGAPVSKMIEQSGAIAGINGGGFNDGADYNSNGGVPYGILIEDGQLINPPNGSGGSYRMIGIREDNVMVIKNGSVEWAMENKLRSAVVAEYFLIVDGEGMIESGDGGWGIAPRTALGQRATGEIIFLVIDGRQGNDCIGADVVTLQEILLEEKCVNAAMIDGGSSTVMEYATYNALGECTVELINSPNLGATLEAQRYINNTWVIMPKQQQTVKDTGNHEGLVAK